MAREALGLVHPSEERCNSLLSQLGSRLSQDVGKVLHAEPFPNEDTQLSGRGRIWGHSGNKLPSTAPSQVNRAMLPGPAKLSDSGSPSSAIEQGPFGSFEALRGTAVFICLHVQCLAPPKM